MLEQWWRQVRGIGRGSAADQRAANQTNDMAATPRANVKDGGTFVWGISQAIANFNYNEVDGTEIDAFNIISALEPSTFHFNAGGTASVNTDYFTSITKKSDSPLVIDYKINPKAEVERRHRRHLGGPAGRGERHQRQGPGLQDLRLPGLRPDRQRHPGLERAGGDRHLRQAVR